MTKKMVLVVEDDADIQEVVSYNLAREGFNVQRALTGEEGLRMAKSRKPDLIVLDLMLPGMDGMEVCRRIRKDPEIRKMPIVMLTAKAEDVDVVTGLEIGADDYVTKPFSPKILTARIRAVLRRGEAAEETAADSITLEGLEIHLGRHEVRVEGRPVILTLTEFKILQLLASHPGWVYSREQIVSFVRGEGYPVTERAVDVQIVGLRKKLGDYGKMIVTVRGVGYKLADEA